MFATASTLAPENAAIDSNFGPANLGYSGLLDFVAELIMVVRSLVLFSRTVRGEYPAWLAWKVLDTLVYIIITAICRRAAAGNAAAKKVDAVLRFLGWVECDDIEP